MMYGGGFGFVWLVWAVLVIIPFWRLLPNYGMANWLAIFAVIPLVALIYLWIMAFNEKSDG